MRARGQLQSVVAAVFLAGTALAIAQPAEVTTASGLRNRLHVTGPDRMQNRALVQATEDAYRKLQPLLRLPPTAPYKIELTIDTDRRRYPVDTFPLRVVYLYEQPTFMATVSLGEAESREAFVRTIVQIMLYQKLISAHEAYLDGETLPLLPLWLTEGALQTLIDSNEPVWKQVIAQAVAGRRAADLDTITQWTTLSDEAVYRSWQQAFCYYLLTSVAEPGDGRTRFHKWLETPKESLDGMEWPVGSLMPSEIEWRSHLADSRERAQPTVLAWDDTAAALAALQTIRLRTGDEGEERVVSLTQIDAEDAALPGNQEALANKRSELLGLELRAHFLWRPVITTMRLALTNLGNPKAKPSSEELMELATQELTRLSEASTKFSDYLNWYEITSAGSDGISQFTPYRRLRLHLDKLDARQSDLLRKEAVKVERQIGR